MKEQIFVIKNDGRKELFVREKLHNGIARACRKLPVTEKEINDIVELVEKEVEETGLGEIKSRALAEIVMKHLRKVSPVACMKFSTVHSDNERLTFYENLRRLAQKHPK